ncbi:ankyrin repeat domain-containing protein 17-like [Macrobrachium nipponense]|uniref:ankyrin repeat domain-containing protein 17-like n=1 Tax=Macrobrachium nipponense TaxID=159736 RepID=UPI0030C7CF9E
MTASHVVIKGKDGVFIKQPKLHSIKIKQNCADINAQTEETQETALTLACCGGFRDVADLLIKAGADLELGASTPLMEAAQEGHRDLVEYLIDAGANVNAQTSTGDTALTYACENGHTDVADLLLQAGANLEHESEGGRTPLMKACRAGHLCTVQFLIVKGGDVNKTTTNNDHTPLSLACAGGHVPVVELLLVHGADPNHKLKDNSTMLMEASRGGHTKVVQLLIDFPSSISHLLPVVGTTQHQVTATTQGPAAELATGAILESDPHQLPMGLTVVQGSDPQQSLVVNPNQIFNDIDERLGEGGAVMGSSGVQTSVVKGNRTKPNRKPGVISTLPTTNHLISLPPLVQMGKS